MEEREGYANETWFKLISPDNLLGTIPRIDPALRLSWDRETRGRIEMGTLLGQGLGASISPVSALIMYMPFVKSISCGMHFWKLSVAIRQAEKTPMTWPASTLPSRTSFAPNQKPGTNNPNEIN